MLELSQLQLSILQSLLNVVLDQRTLIVYSYSLVCLLQSGVLTPCKLLNDLISDHLLKCHTAQGCELSWHSLNETEVEVKQIFVFFRKQMAHTNRP